MKNRMLILITAGLVTAVSAQTPAPSPTPIPETPARWLLQQILLQARKDYQSNEVPDLKEAAAAFGLVESTGDDGEFDLDALRLAEGITRLRADDPEGALESFSRIQGLENPQDRSRHRMWKGVAHLKKGAAFAESAAWEDAIAQAREAIDALTQSLKDNPESTEARKNLELAHRHLADYQARKPPPTPTPTPQPTPEPTPTPEATPTPEPTPTPTPEPEDGSENQPTPTPDPQEGDSREQENAGEDSQEDEQQGDPQQQDQQPGGEQESSASGAELSQEEIDAEQARQILDAYLEQEKAQRRQWLQQRIRGIPVEKDW